ncbi:lysozyme inhibitor LprI family protein [Zobellella sp. DQSA1]|uniref:lysozyme inhibitor LprI family protein n=1 Tax=Zobellella sp. DQSA1 TaxID=3342386 RepID=UPI0035BFA516
MHTALLQAEQQQHLDKQLARQHQELVAQVALSAPVGMERVVAALQAQQAAWLNYRREECELVGSLTGAGGTWPSTHAIICEVTLTEQRLGHVQRATQCIERTRNEERTHGQSDCLQPLASLVHR